MRFTVQLTYRLVNGSEEVDLILKSIDLSLKLNLVHVGSIDILRGRRGGGKVEILQF